MENVRPNFSEISSKNLCLFYPLISSRSDVVVYVEVFILMALFSRRRERSQGERQQSISR
jgi:hypothetical protein